MPSVTTMKLRGAWCVVGVSALLLPCLFSQTHGNKQVARMGVPHDWSHSHVVFSRPASLPTAMQLQKDNRFWQQSVQHHATVFQREVTHAIQDADAQGFVFRHQRHHRHARVDWSVTLGHGGSSLAQATFPAKYSFDINAGPSCANDFVVFALSINGAGNQATIVGYNNLYTEPGGTGFCSGTGPTVNWAYNAGTLIQTSPVLSLNGTKVAWVTSANPPILHVLTIGTTGSNGTSVISPAVPGTGNNAVNTTVTYGSRGNTRSSVFVDYKNDVGYVGADDGNVYKFTGIFQGTPALVSGGGWPVTVRSDIILTAPIFDSVTKNIFVGGSDGNLYYVREVGSTLGACTSGSPPCLGSTSVTVSNGHAVVEPPIVDSTTGGVFAEAGDNGAGNAELVQADTALSGSSVVTVLVGRNGGQNLYSGAFDNNYFTSVGTGFLYLCGKAASSERPTLYRIGFNSSGVLNSTTDGSSLVLSTNNNQCSPLTEIFNSPTNRDWLFVSVPNACTGSGGGNAGCIMSFDITSGFPSASAHATAEASGTSGIVVDNVSTAAQASSIYFTNLNNATCGDGIGGGGCAVKLTQAGLN